MTTFTIELDDESARKIEQMAQDNKVSSQELVTRAIMDFAYELKNVPQDSQDEKVSDEEFQATAKRIIERDAELLQRLAQ